MPRPPLPAIAPNTPDYENLALVAPTGFREYDARWIYEKQINLNGIQALGAALGTQLHEIGVPPRIVVGHDYRAYSGAIKQALMTGLMSAGAEVLDIGLCLSPTAYFAQFALDCAAVAMVTASHNENGWTGVKIGAERPLTHGPKEMARLKDLVLTGAWKTRAGGSYERVEGIDRLYVNDLTQGVHLEAPLKVVAACGNGTAGLFAEQVLTAIGCEVVPLHCTPDHTFPHHNPNPEDMTMLHAMAQAVADNNADVALGFDGDGDRCGVVDDTGAEIFADKIGLLIARDLAPQYPGSKFVVDVKSTGLFMTDPVLKAHKCTTDYWKTGHSYMKRRVNGIGALVGFEKSGHYFFNDPVGRGYDDGLLSAIALCQLLARNKPKSLSQLKGELGKTWSSPTMAPYCADERKYQIVEAMVEKVAATQTVAGLEITDRVTVNGVRFTLEDGGWGLIRASSNKPSLVIVVESPTSETAMRAIFTEIDGWLQATGEVGAYDQKL